MKKHLLTCWALFLALTSAYAQQQEQTRYLIDGKSTISGFGGLFTEFSVIKDLPAVSSGAGGGILINQTVFLGGYGMGTATERHMDIPGYSSLHLRMGHGGLWLGYLYRPSRLLHAGINTKLGWGAITLNRDYNGISTENRTINTDNIFVVTPQVEAELNVARWFKINLGAGYRWVTGIDKPYYRISDFSSPTGTIGLLFGGFGRR